MNYLGKSILIIIVVLISFISCKEEIKPLENYNWEPGMAFPIAHTTLTLGDLIPEDDPNFSSDESGLLHFHFREDSIIGFSVEDILTIPSQQEEEMSFTLGEISLDDFGPVVTHASLNNMLEMLDTTTAIIIQALDGTTTIVPELISIEAKEFEFNNFDAFEYVTFSSGQLILKVTNTLPIEFSSCSITFNTVAPDGTIIYIGDFIFTNFVAASVQTETIQLDGLTLYNDFAVTINSFTTVESPTPVLIELTAGLEFSVTSSNLKVIAGKAKIPIQNIASQDDTISISVDGQERLTYLAFNNASIDYYVESSLSIDANFTINLPNVTIDGQPAELNFSATDQTTGSLDLSNSLFDLTQDPEQPYNNFLMIVSFEIQSTNEWVEFDSSSTISIQYSIQDIEFELAQGWVGVQEITFDSDSVYTGFSELENILGTITFSEPDLHILVTNSIGLPIGFQIDMESYNTVGSSVDLDADMLQFPYPVVPYDIVNDYVSLNNQNSNLSEFLAVIPDYFIFGGSVKTNPDSATTGVVYNNFITNDGIVNLGLEFELPFILTIDGLLFSDTLDFSMEDVKFEDAVSGHFSIFTVNGIPLETTINLAFVDSNNFETLDTYDITLLKAATVDEDGVVISTSSQTTIIELEESKFDALAKANKVIITALFNTTNSNTQDVSFYSDYTLDVHLAALINYSIEIEQ